MTCYLLLYQNIKISLSSLKVDTVLSCFFFLFLIYNILFYLLLLLLFFFCFSKKHAGSPNKDRTCVHYGREHRVLTTGIPGKSLLFFRDYTVKHWMYHRQ